MESKTLLTHHPPLPLRNLSENSFVLVGVYIPIFKRPGGFICCRTVSLHQAGDLTCWIAIFQIWGGIVSNVLCSHTGDFFPSHLRTFLLNFVATGVYALSLNILKSLPAVFFPFLVWAKFWVPPLPRIWSWDIVFDSRDHYFWYSRTQGFSKIYHMYGFWGCIAL